MAPPNPADIGILKNFSDGPDNSTCPPECCYKTDEYCMRLYGNTGYEVGVDEEYMLVFGGQTQNEVIIDDKGTNIADNCTIDLDDILSQSQTVKQSLNVMFLTMSCGMELLNELYQYNIKKDEWKIIKPYIDETQQTTQQKPFARYGHSSVFIETVESDISRESNVLRKYMYVYGGYSLYCQNACEDFWSYEISYAPQRYYPAAGNNWYRGNVWTNIQATSTQTPGKRLFHAMVTDNTFNYIYLFGGLTINANQKYESSNDLWRYDLILNIWEKIDPLGFVNITRQVVYWDGTNDTVLIPPEEYDIYFDKPNIDRQSNLNSSNSNIDLIFPSNIKFYKNRTQMWTFSTILLC